ncbi:MAG: site-2 protease family protein, partial [Verrucomicrobiota bacterium]
MKWSWRVLTVAGIGVYIHVTFLLLLIWAGWYGYSPRQSWWDAAGQIGFVLALFGIVVLHELGHALTARRFGIGTKDITLLPIGGVARLERMPEDPKQELLVALAGPAVNVILAALLFVGLAVAGQFSDPEWMLHSSGNFFVRLMAVNVLLAVFNMLPAFPMDGGRVLRALLAFRLSYARATRIAARIGQGMAVLFGFAGLLGPNP